MWLYFSGFHYSDEIPHLFMHVAFLSMRYFDSFISQEFCAVILVWSFQPLSCLWFYCFSSILTMRCIFLFSHRSWISYCTLNIYRKKKKEYRVSKVSVCACMLSRVQLCDPMDCHPPGSSVHVILQARILEHVAISFSRGSPWPRDWTCISGISFIGRQILHHLGILKSK